MQTVTVLIWIIASITATLGVLQLVIWFADRSRLERLAFFFASFGSAVFAAYEIGTSHAETPEQYFHLFRLQQVPGLVFLIGIAWFVHSSLKTGRRWLFWTFIVLRVINLALNLLLPYGTNWKEVDSMGQTTIFGEVLYFPTGVASPVALLPIIGFIILMIYSLDASFRAWMPGNRIRVAVHGFGVALWALAILGLVFGRVFGLHNLPGFVTPAFVFLNVAASIQMLLDMYRSARLADSLTESEAKLAEVLAQLHLTADAGEVGLWRRNFDEPHFWSNEKARELFGFSAGAVAGPRGFLEHVHEDDIARVIQAMKDIANSGVEFEIEFRIRRPDGEIRWIHSHGDVVSGEPMFVRGASVDITKRKAAEHEAHELAQKLIYAQEAERARLARDLHDGLGQSIALLSIRVDEFRKDTAEPKRVEAMADDLEERLHSLGSDVRQISHELHPAKLKLLGLDAVLRGFCREISETHWIQIDLTVSDLPDDLHDDLTICFYRVAQEALQNIIKHSGVAKASVRLGIKDGELVLEVIDEGIGFDVEAAATKGTLGLVSISERMLAVGGESKVRSIPGKGTTVEARVPMP